MTAVPPVRRVLVTGSAGSIGRTLMTGLPGLGHEAVGLDRADAEFSGDVADPELLDRALVGCTAVVHLASRPDEAPLEDELRSHVLSAEAVLQAARRAGVRRVVLASSNHAVGRHARDEVPGGVLGADARPRPDTAYGVAKVALEALGSLYVDRYGLEVVALRIGTFRSEPSDLRSLASWLSPGDAVRLVDACLRSPDVGFAVVHGISANTRGWWDHAPGRALGYHPVDDSEAFAGAVLARSSGSTAERDDRYVGGGFVDESYDIAP